MLLNLDIWYEVVRNLTFIEDESTLSSLAVTSRRLSKLALDATWRTRNCENILTIVSVINSFARPSDEPFLELRQAPENDTGDSDDEDEDSSTQGSVHSDDSSDVSDSQGDVAHHWVSFPRLFIQI